MTLSEKKLKFNYYLQEINPKDKNLLIIDAYLFPQNCTDDYKELIKYLLNESNFSKLTIITKHCNYNQDTFNNVTEELDRNNINVIFSNNFHDRFWITDSTAGFSTGTSLNGIGSKICRINFLSNDEISDIISIIHTSLPDIDI